MDVFQLAPNHNWKASPGCRILVVDHGGVRCDTPRDWLVVTRVCAARAEGTQAILVFDFQMQDRDVLAGVWETLTATLVVGDYIEDPTTGKRRMRRG